MTPAVAGTRERISVVLPFLGDAGEARALLERLTTLRVTHGDELIVADNTPDGVVAPLAHGSVTVTAASDRRSASHARNIGARSAVGKWLLFLDADCVPPADLLDRYFVHPPGAGTAIVAGEIEGEPDQDALLARWARSRRGQWVRHHLANGPLPAGVTANMLVRRSVFEQLGGFRIGGGGDLDLSWRAQKAGWELEYRPDVVVRHRDRETFAALADQAISYGGHQRRLRELHGRVVPRPPLLRPLGRSLAGAVAWTATGKFERARFKLIDGVWACLFWWGHLAGGPRGRRAD
jgi:GT2 family glycosyltransferase